MKKINRNRILLKTLKRIIMKKIYSFVFLILLFIGSINAQVVKIYDGFENYQDFIVSNIGNWTLIDNDGVQTYNIQGHTFTNQEYIGAYIVFNPASVSPSVVDDWPTHSGNKMLACFDAVSSTNDDWIISQEFTAGTVDTVSLWVKSITDQYGLERYNVYLMNGTTSSDIVQKLNSGTNYDEAPTAWTYLEYVITGHEGENLRIGVQCVSNDAFAFLLDDIKVSGQQTAGLNNFLNEKNVFPNPTTGIINIIGQNPYVKITDVQGKIICQGRGNVFDLTDQPAGIYFVEINTNTDLFVEKIVKK